MKKFAPLLIAAACICTILVFAWIISIPLGEEEINVTKDAYAILENGEKVECSVRFFGTLYIDSPKHDVDHFFGNIDGGIWIGNKCVLQQYVFVDSEEPVVLGAEDGYYYLSRDMSVFVAKVNSEYLGLDVEPQDVVVVLKENTPEQYEPIMEQIESKTK